MNKKLTHIDEQGRAQMVSVTDKKDTNREAIACGFVRMSPTVISAIRSGATKKGDALETARLAGIMAAKKTFELIPLCHPLQLTGIEVDVVLQEKGVKIESRVACTGKTGVEMEALTAVSVAALTIYDMCKAIDKTMVIEDIHLIKKSGGKSGTYIFPTKKEK